MTDLEITSAGVLADRAQQLLDDHFGAPWPQLLHNGYPTGDDVVFNYWWLAHLIDVRLDAYLRTGDQRSLKAAIATCRNIKERNGGSLFNDYFDDMLWYALAILRLHRATGDAAYRDDAAAIWRHVIEHGWNDHVGPSLAWRKQQLDYKNTPANGPLVILSCRLAELADDQPYLDYARQAFDWLTETLVDPVTGFVEDGINRQQDGRIDTQWRFSYNQGLYVGAAVELGRTVDDPDELIKQAIRTAATAIDELAPDGVFPDEGDGDGGLFKGVYYRYLGMLLDRLDPQSAAGAELRGFVIDSTDALIESTEGCTRLAGNDWRTPRSGKLKYSTQLSAIMALELRARL